MPLADVYITNGGYGGVLMGIQNQLPLVVAGVHEGKNEINARIGYFNLGINLKTETPTPEQIRVNVEQVFTNPVYKNNVIKLSQEFDQYNPLVLTEKYVAEILGETVRPETTPAVQPQNKMRLANAKEAITVG
jgi:UDP:flavonoid glycosyltransferase YjiC (YdhE family)